MSIVDILDSEIRESKKVLSEIELSLGKMQQIGTVEDSVHRVSLQLGSVDHQVKFLLKFIIALAAGAMFSGIIVAYHLHADQTRFEQVTKSLEIMNQRTDFLLTLNKELQQQIVSLHAHDQCKR